MNDSATLAHVSIIDIKIYNLKEKKRLVFNLVRVVVNSMKQLLFRGHEIVVGGVEFC